jgi:hypothetical protein
MPAKRHLAQRPGMPTAGKPGIKSPDWVDISFKGCPPLRRANERPLPAPWKLELPIRCFPILGPGRCRCGDTARCFYCAGLHAAPAAALTKAKAIWGRQPATADLFPPLGGLVSTALHYGPPWRLSVGESACLGLSPRQLERAWSAAYFLRPVALPSCPTCPSHLVMHGR